MPTGISGPIEERIPLKQGLKHVSSPIALIIISIEERIPLKQGLKQFNPTPIFSFFRLKREFH